MNENPEVLYNEQILKREVEYYKLCKLIEEKCPHISFDTIAENEDIPKYFFKGKSPECKKLIKTAQALQREILELKKYQKKLVVHE